MRWTALQLPARSPRVSPSRALIAGVLLTLGLHLGGMLVLWLEASRADEAPEEQKALVVQTELLQWGETQPDAHTLPNIANPRPSDRHESPEARPKETREAATETVDLHPESKTSVDDTDTTLRPELKEQPKDLPTANYRGETNPHRPTNDLAIEGFEHGFQGGTSLSPSAQRNMLARIQQQLQQAFSPPRTLSDAQLRDLRIQLHVRIASDGKIVGWKVLSASGNRQFDIAATMTLNRFKNGSQRLDLDSIQDADFRALIEKRGLPIVMVGQ